MDSLEEPRDEDGYTNLENVVLTAVLKSAFVYVATAKLTDGMDMQSPAAIEIVAQSEQQILHIFNKTLEYNGYTVVRKEPALGRLIH